MTTNTLLKNLLNVKHILIESCEYCEESNTLTIYAKNTKGYRNRCPICGKKCSGYDTTTVRRVWRHLDFGSTAVIIAADVQRIYCKEHGVHTEEVSWAYHNSRFTKEFEQQVAYLALHLNKTEVSRIMRISWNTVGPVITRVRNRIEPDRRVRYKNLRRIGIDETSYQKGHKYVTVVLDHDTNQVIWVGKGTGIEVLTSFFQELSEEERNNIQLVSADGARWIQTCIEKWLPKAERCIDGFHVISWAIEAVDTLRKEIWHEAKLNDSKQSKRKRGRPRKGETVEGKQSTRVKGLKYAIGKNPENLTVKQVSSLDMVKEVYPRMFRGYLLKEGLRQVFKSSPWEVKEELDKWLRWACRSRIEVFVELSRKIRRHYKAILATVKHGLSNARLESTNNKIKVIIRKAYGFRNTENMKDMILLICSNLYKEIRLPYENKVSMRHI